VVKRYTFDWAASAACGKRHQNGAAEDEDAFKKTTMKGTKCTTPDKIKAYPPSPPNKASVMVGRPKSFFLCDKQHC